MIRMILRSEVANLFEFFLIQSIVYLSVLVLFNFVFLTIGIRNLSSHFETKNYDIYLILNVIFYSRSYVAFWSEDIIFEF
jgi:hypothetical protein